MKKVLRILPIIFIMILLFFSGCATKKSSIDKQTIDGVEIIQNHIKPYKVSREPSVFEREEILKIDLEKINFCPNLAEPTHN